jgi:hypothetical protein
MRQFPHLKTGTVGAHLATASGLQLGTRFPSPIGGAAWEDRKMVESISNLQDGISLIFWWPCALSDFRTGRWDLLAGTGLLEEGELTLSSGSQCHAA